MEQQQPTTEALGTTLFSDAWKYVDDAWQRSFLFMDVLRKRGNIYHEHMAEGNPPVLTFDYKIVMDGRTFEKPVNFALVKIVDRRTQPGFKTGDDDERRAVQLEGITLTTTSIRRPIVIIDPRAGHGPGIGGSKRDSEIGVALTLGHPVYFILFYPNPEPDQTLTDVQRSQVKFIEEIGRLHPEAGKPALIGNCQGGWASALIGAERPDITGPLVFNGSPLSYWAGVDGKNPMRYKGGLTGGTWMASLWSDLGAGKFDGANLVSGFEDLNPGNTLWTKQYNVYAKVDTEEQRYLDFERWWNGYYYMTAEEIRFIVANLFVGNRLEQGLLELDEDTRINLKNIKDPILVFASSGDNITPPQQALNWIVKVWGSVEELENQGQVVVYLLHKTIGHLGIFVSTKVSKKEHTEIIGSIDLMEYLNPGLYEMVIDEGEGFAETGDYKVKFDERTMDDILALDDGNLDEEDFRAVSAVSDFNDEFYQTFVSPWVKWLTTEDSAEMLRQVNPLRLSQSAFSDNNPWMAPFKAWAPLVKENRRQVSQDNLFLSLEKSNAKAWAGILDTFRDLRDDAQEFCFKTIYGNQIVRDSFEKRINEITAKEDKLKSEMEAQDKTKKVKGQKKMRADMEKGGFLDGLFRLMAALIGVDHTIEQEELKFIRKLVTIHNIMTHTNEAELKQRMLDQVKLLQYDEELAIAAIPKLVRGAENRLTAIQMLEALNETDTIDTSDATKLLNKIRAMLDDKKTLE
jgi:pimeloyl-ACP methyl ester carboxylesterase